MCGVGGVCTVVWCVQVKRMIRGIGNVLFSTNSQTLKINVSKINEKT